MTAVVEADAAPMPVADPITSARADPPADAAPMPVAVATLAAVLLLVAVARPMPVANPAAEMVRWYSD